MSSTPSKPCQDEDARSRSDSSEKWAVVEKSARRLKYSEVAGAGDSLSNSEGFVKSVAIQVNNLNSTTSVKSLRAYFSKFGEIIDISTSQPGSAYVQFQKFYDDNPLASLNHVIDGR